MMSRKRRAELIRRAFDILLEYPDGLPPKNVLERIGETFPLTESELSAHPSRPLRSFEEVVWIGTIAPAKAGWLRNDDERWRLTEEGERACQQFRDPEEFVAEASKHSRKGWASVKFPAFYSLATKTFDKLRIEYRLIRRIGPKQLFGMSVGATAPWQQVLPLQKPQRFCVKDANFKDAQEIVAHLDSAGAKYSQGGHTIYLPPRAVGQSAFRDVLENYPAGVGLKIIKAQGGVSESDYIREGYGNGRGQSVFQKKITHDRSHLSLVANLLFTKGVGPKLYDLVELQCGEYVWTAYVMEHVEGSTPTQEDCVAGVSRIRELEEQGLIKNNIPDGWEDEDFTCPTCNGNALLDGAGKFHYIDFQNFILTGYEAFLRETAIEATEKSHFGDTFMLRGGGRYLYQKVPGVALPAKRNVEERMIVLKELMEQAGVTVSGRLVLDVGCNIGMMMGQYLKLGAKWCHGWDRAYVTPHTEKMLHALGCTRVSTTGGDISSQQPLETDVPEFLRDSLNGCAISYLAVRGHLGWLEALGRVPWAFIIYEGHEAETREDFENYMEQLGQLVKFRVAGVSVYEDGDSDERTVAILVREEN
ncbi:MAG: hypothetical protein WCB68_11260 [Pyrinomonadaceae bacterium]